MKDKAGVVENEDVVIDTVLKGDDKDILKLLREQPSYSDFMRDIQSVKEGLKSIEEEEPPAFLVENIIKKNGRPLFSRLQDLPLLWYKSPYLLSFCFVMAIVFFYLFLEFFLK
jgi:hypothetical protein